MLYQLSYLGPRVARGGAYRKGVVSCPAAKATFLHRLPAAPASPKPGPGTGGNMSDIRRIGAGPRMSKAVVRGNAVYTAGQVAEKTKGGSVADQTREILGLIEALLAEAGSEKAKILSATIYLSDISTFAEMNGVWDVWVDKENPPARATVEAKLVTPDYKVEIAVIAAR
jgi:enamine deaminase RidA (YjgF/YER057c/UK114 family)